LNLNSRLAGHNFEKTQKLYETAIKAKQKALSIYKLCPPLFYHEVARLKPRQNKKALRLVGVTISTLPPEKQLGFAPQNPNFPNKNRRNAPESVEKFVFGVFLRPS